VGIRRLFLVDNAVLVFGAVGLQRNGLATVERQLVVRKSLIAVYDFFAHDWEFYVFLGSFQAFVAVFE
jgi:hypothetical protein